MIKSTSANAHPDHVVCRLRINDCKYDRLASLVVGPRHRHWRDSRMMLERLEKTGWHCGEAMMVSGSLSSTHEVVVWRGRGRELAADRSAYPSGEKWIRYTIIMINIFCYRE